MNKEFKYDVAFSFTQQDERIAYEINDLIQDQYKTFIYSQHQDILAGSDGETIFSEVFSEQARIVIVLYRSSWGESKWTRVEKDAIQNRSRDNGYGFCIFIPLDDDMSMPPWIPANYIYYNLNRFGVSELVPVIKHKIHEAGGINKPESIQDAAERLKRHKNAQLERLKLLNNPSLATDVFNEIESIFNALKSHKITLDYLGLGMQEQLGQYYHVAYKGYIISVSWTAQLHFSTDIKEEILTFQISQRTGHAHFDQHDHIIKSGRYSVDIDLSGKLGWKDIENETQFRTSEMLVDEWVKLFIKGLHAIQ